MDETYRWTGQKDRHVGQMEIDRDGHKRLRKKVL
jgi:hypothetical protein